MFLLCERQPTALASTKERNTSFFPHEYVLSLAKDLAGNLHRLAKEAVGAVLENDWCFVVFQIADPILGDRRSRASKGRA